MSHRILSIIVPVRNEEAHIRQTLECLLKQEFDPESFEVIVVDGCSEDDTVQMVREMQPRFRHLTLLDNPNRLSSSARNIGIRQSTGDYIVIVDGHCAIPEVNYLTNIVRAFRISAADCLGRPQPLKSVYPTSFQRSVSLARESWLGHNPDSAIFSDRAGFLPAQNVAVAYRREVFVKVGFFDERFDACEDVELNTRIDRLGLTCYFTPTIRVNYSPRKTLRGLMYQMYRYGQGRARLAKKFPSSITIPSLVPSLWLLTIVLGIGFSFLSSIVMTMVALCLAAYSFVVVGESVRLSRGRINRESTRLPILFVAIHLGFGWGFLREAIRVKMPLLPWKVKSFRSLLTRVPRTKASPIGR